MRGEVLKEDKEVEFSFFAGQYNGPLTPPTYRREVIDFDMTEEVESLLGGIIPEAFPWMAPVVADQIAEQKTDLPGRFMAVVRELQRSQNLADRDLDYEKRCEALGRLLYDSCDENFNYLGFFLSVETEDGALHRHEWGRLNLKGDAWWVDDSYPITEITGCRL